MKKGKLDLKAVSEDVFNYFLGNQFPGGKVILGENISNPFLPSPQKTPSFNILRATDGNHIYLDFATGHTGNCVSFVSNLKGISRNAAIQQIRKITNK